MNRNRRRSSRQGCVIGSVENIRKTVAETSRRGNQRHRSGMRPRISDNERAQGKCKEISHNGIAEEKQDFVNDSTRCIERAVKLEIKVRAYPRNSCGNLRREARTWAL